MSKETLSSHGIRRIILEQSKRAHVGHIGSALSIVDIIATLYLDVLRIPAPDDPERDRFILSKGHAALAVYAALFLRGELSETELNTFCSDSSLVGVHPEHSLRGIDFSTGSLGHGLSIGAGAALAARLQQSGRRVFVLVSDAECNEGSVWEAVMFAAHHQLTNLIAVVDLNGQQAFGYTDQVLSLSPLAERWRAFAWDVHDVDGHRRVQDVQQVPVVPVLALLPAIRRVVPAPRHPQGVVVHQLVQRDADARVKLRPDVLLREREGLRADVDPGDPAEARDGEAALLVVQRTRRPVAPALGAAHLPDGAQVVEQRQLRLPILRPRHWVIVAVATASVP